MNKRILKFVSILLFLMAIIGCDLVMSKGVDSEINISIFEELPSRNFRMHFSTTKIYGVMDNHIELSWHRSQMGFDISFEGVIENGIFDALGPATAIIDLGVLNTGTYPLILRNGQEKFSGKLFVFSDKYVVTFDLNPTFNFLNPSINRIPDDTIWGLVGYHTEETMPLVRSFLSELIELGAREKSFVPGNYNNFRIDQNGDIVIHYDTGYRFFQAFIFYYSADTSELGRFLEQWSDLYREIMSIQIFTDKGETYFSWAY